VVTNTGKVLNTAATDKNNAMLLQVVTYTGNVSGHFNTVGQTYTGDLTKSGVRLLRGSGLHYGANTTLLRGVLIDGNALLGVPAFQQSRGLGLLLYILSAFANELIKGWHSYTSSK
jgi:hypothetical protein